MVGRAAQVLSDAGRPGHLASRNRQLRRGHLQLSAICADRFPEVEDNLAALRILEQEAEQQHTATSSAQEALQIFKDRYIGGADPYLQVITAQTAALSNERNDVDILRRRMDGLADQTLGGGWSVLERLGE